MEGEMKCSKKEEGWAVTDEKGEVTIIRESTKAECVKKGETIPL